MNHLSRWYTVKPTIILLTVMERLDGRAYENIEIDKIISTYIMIC